MLKRIFSVITLVFVCFCGSNSGELAFAQIDEGSMLPLEKYYFVPRTFRKVKTPAIFEANKRLWFSFKPPFKLYGDLVYAVSLSKKSLGYIEIDLRNLTLTPGVSHLVDYYEDLEPGDYLLRIANDSKILSEFVFEVNVDDSDTIIDYDAEVIDDTNGSSVADDILTLSR